MAGIINWVVFFSVSVVGYSAFAQGRPKKKIVPPASFNVILPVNMKNVADIEAWYAQKKTELQQRERMAQTTMDDLYYRQGNSAGNISNPDNKGLGWHWDKITEYNKEIARLEGAVVAKMKAGGSADLREAADMKEKITEMDNNRKVWNERINAPGGAKEKLERYKADFASIRQEMEALDKMKAAATLDLKTQVNGLRTQLKAMSLETDVTEGIKEIEKIEGGYAMFENKYDNKMIKVYLMQKFNSLLNSKAFCEANRDADKKCEKYGGKSYNLNDIFPNAAGADGTARGQTAAGGL